MNSDLQILAERLAFNNVNVSLSKLIHENNGSGTQNFNYSSILNEKHPATQEPNPLPERNIVIVGAGASKNACLEFETGQKTAEALEKKFEKRLGDQVLKDELRRLEQVYRLPKGEFETILFAISKFFPKDLKKELSDLLQSKFQPSLTYEILAHLFKHRFVDVIINFNFDEMLDQAISDEMNPSEYQRIISDGDYDRLLLNHEYGLRYPVYIKPHGTVSHPSSMRFTREDYFGLPAEIENAIGDLIHPKVEFKSLGKTLESTGGDEMVALPVNIIIIGFDLQSFEFNLLLDEKLPENVRFFIFSVGGEESFFVKNQNGEKKDFTPKLETLLKKEDSKFINVSKSSSHALDNLFLELWGKIESLYNPEYKPRNIARHELISKLFQSDEKRRSNEDIGEYLQDRALLEFALSIAKYKGFLCIEQLVSDRFGKYFGLLKQQIGPKKLKYKTIPDYCKAFNLHDYGYGKTAFSLNKLSEKNRSKQQLTVSFVDFFEEHYENIIKVLKRSLSEKARTRLMSIQEDEKGFRGTIEKLFQSQDTEICPEYHNVYQNIFLDPKIISTQLAFEYNTRHQFLNINNYDKVLIVAETGEWLQNYLASNEWPPDVLSKEYCLIIADQAKHLDKDGSGEGLHSLRIESLQWWLHNQHMTIFMKKGQDKWEPTKAIYFTRVHRTIHINPILLENSNDLNIILKTFSAYLMKAQNKVTDIGDNELDQFMNDFLKVIK
ncbi:MAG: SIR2 family protein [Saprospiraceae bacterium]